jgi:hypothetical protein
MEGFSIDTTVIERPKPGRVLWAISTSLECADGSCIFATAGGTRVVVYTAPAISAGGGIEAVCELESPNTQENFYTVALTVIDKVTHILAVAGEHSTIQLWDISSQRCA